MKDKLSIADKLILVCFDLEEKGRSPFSAEDLVVAAWKRFPDAFGLSGHTANDGRPLYPDSNRVFAEIMGTKPLRKRGFLVKVGSKIYQLTEAGRRQAKSLETFNVVSPIPKVSLRRELILEVRRLFKSRAVEKVRAGRSEDLNFYDACGFWGISPRSNAKDLKGRFAHLEATIETALEGTKQEGVVSFEHGGTSFTTGDLQKLRSIHAELEERFQKELEIIRERSQERR